MSFAVEADLRAVKESLACRKSCSCNVCLNALVKNGESGHMCSLDLAMRAQRSRATTAGAFQERENECDIGPVGLEAASRYVVVTRGR